MDATLIVIDSDAELVRARALVDRLMTSDAPADITRLAAQARLIAAYEENKRPRRLPRAAEVIRYLMDQHGLTRGKASCMKSGDRNNAITILRPDRYLK